jgi:predicted histidine transporter YuiF (NhaC family)
MAVIAALAAQLAAKDVILSALAGFLFLSLGGVIRRKDSDNVVARGFKMMALISFTMLAAAGFGHILRVAGGIDNVVNWLASHSLHGKAMASFGMLLVGFLISVGIGSSFSTVPIVASVYVPLGMKLGFSPAAIAVIVAISGVTGDAGSPASDSTLGPTMGLNADGQHSLVRDTAIPTFLHLTIPAFLVGWLASVVL